MNETCMPAKRHSWLSGEQLLRPSPAPTLSTPQKIMAL
jgi:hypothetical protein